MSTQAKDSLQYLHNRALYWESQEPIPDRPPSWWTPISARGGRQGGTSQKPTEGKSQNAAEGVYQEASTSCATKQDKTPVSKKDKSTRGGPTSRKDKLIRVTGTGKTPREEKTPGVDLDMTVHSELNTQTGSTPRPGSAPTSTSAQKTLRFAKAPTTPLTEVSKQTAELTDV
jgi:hypothetical protein